MELYDKYYNECFPLVKKSKKRSKDKNWVSPEVIKSCNKKSKLYKIWINNKTSFNLQVYKSFVNTHNKLVKKTKQKYYFDNFHSIKDNAKELWAEINRISNLSSKNRSTGLTIKNILHNNSIVNDPTQIADTLNNFFCNIGKKLSDNLPPANSTTTYWTNLPKMTPCSFVFDSIEPVEVFNVIYKLKNRKSTGLDNVQAKFVKFVDEFKDVFSPLLAKLFNMSIMNGIFPTDLKIAKTIPILKPGNDKQLCSSYRPISLLSIFSKIFETLIAVRLRIFKN